MPAVLTAHQADAFDTDRFKPAIERVETPNYNQRSEELRDDWRRRFEQSKYLTIKYGLIDADRELNRISQMEADWDSYGAEPPSAAAIHTSREILMQLAGDLILPSTIVPSAEGGVSIYFIADNKTAYVESYNEGPQVLVMYDDEGNTNVLEIGTEIPLADLSGRIVAHLA